MEIPLRISYQEFQKMDYIPAGAIIVGVNPNKLETIQDWIDATKAAKVMAALLDGQSPQRLPIASVRRHPSGKNKLVLREGNTKSAAAKFAHSVVDVQITDEPYREKPRFYNLSSIANRYSSLLRPQ